MEARILKLLFLLALLQSTVYCAPSATTLAKRRKPKSDQLVDITASFVIPNLSEEEAETILNDLGYNDIEDSGDFSIGSRFSGSDHSSIKNLIRLFQRENDLEETGVLDDTTKLLIDTPHCGSKMRANKGGTSKWRKNMLSYRIHNFPRGKRAGPIRALLTKAFTEWSKVTNLDFVEVDNRNADIEILFGERHHRQRGDSCSFDDPKTLAHAFFPEVGDIHFNTNYFFNDEDSTLEDFLDTALHEIGHSLGLDHSPSRASLMHPTESNGFTEPQPMDVKKIQELYGTRRDSRSMQSRAPSLCSLSKFNAALDDEDGNVYILAGNYYYTLTEDGVGEGQLISTKWPGLSGNIDAAFRYLDGRSYFFKGNKYWRFKGGRLEPGHPRLISKGFPGLPKNLDAIILDGDGDLIAFKDSMYWVYNPSSKQVHPSSPSSISTLGLTGSVDAALDTDEDIMVFRGLKSYAYSARGKFRISQQNLLAC